MLLASILKRLGTRYPRTAVRAKPIVLPLLNYLSTRAQAITEIGCLLATAMETKRHQLRGGRHPAMEFVSIWSAESRQESLAQVARCRLFKAADEPGAPGIASNAQGRTVLMVVISDLRIDPRVEREARALAAAGYRVHVVCPDFTIGADPNVVIDWGPGVSIHLIDWRTLQYIMKRPGFVGVDLYDATLSLARTIKPFAVHAHDLNTCLVGLAVAHQTGAHLVVDFHEWTSENVRWDAEKKENVLYPLDWKAELQALESRVMREASAVITVCDSIADAIASELGGGRKLHVIRNVPRLALEPSKPYPPLKEQLGLSGEQFVVLYQGGTGPTRLIEPIIEALEHVPACTLVIRGPSLEHFGEGYREIARRGGFENRLILLPPVPSQDVIAAARGADAGIYSVLGVGKNFIYALPNKIFEYAAAGLPVLAADYPEASRFVRENGIGLTFDPTDKFSVADAITKLMQQASLVAHYRAASERLTDSLLRHDEWLKLVELYDNLPRVQLHDEGRA